MEENTNPAPQVVVVEKQKNGIGVAGFVLAICALVFCWVPIVNYIVWFLGLLFSFIGVFKKPKGLSIAGLVISLIGIIVDIVILGAAAGAVSELIDFI